jgi:hypothetical protein
MNGDTLSLLMPKDYRQIYFSFVTTEADIVLKTLE